MQYTKDNIIGLIIRKKKGKGVAEYIIQQCVISPRLVEVKHIKSNYINAEYTEVVINYLNRGTWVIAEAVKYAPVEETYQIY